MKQDDEPEREDDFNEDVSEGMKIFVPVLFAILAAAAIIGFCQYLYFQDQKAKMDAQVKAVYEKQMQDLKDAGR